MSYTPRQHYSPEELDKAALRDLLSDAAQSREQAANGPFWPERGITRESLLAYAERCEARAAKYASGGAHHAVLTGRD